MAKKKKAKKETEASIEESMQELQEIVSVLEGGQEPLDQSLEKFERGMALLRSCHQQLEQAASRIEILTRINSDGEYQTAPFDGAATHAQSKPQPSAPSSSPESADSGDERLF